MFYFQLVKELPLEKEMATHSGILAWEIPWKSWWAIVHRVTRVRHDLVSKPPPLPRNFHTVLHMGCIHLPSHQQCMKRPFSPHSLQHLLLVDFFDDGHLINVRCYLIVILTCISAQQKQTQMQRTHGWIPRREGQGGRNWQFVIYKYTLLIVVQSLSHVQLLGDPMDCSLPGSSVRGISQTRTLEGVTISSFGDLPSPGIKLGSPTWQADSLTLSHQGSSYTIVTMYKIDN